MMCLNKQQKFGVFIQTIAIKIGFILFCSLFLSVRAPFLLAYGWIVACALTFLLQCVVALQVSDPHALQYSFSKTSRGQLPDNSRRLKFRKPST